MWRGQAKTSPIVFAYENATEAAKYSAIDVRQKGW